MGNSFKCYRKLYLCPVLGRNVNLELSYMQYSIKGSNSKSGMVDCSAATECGVKTPKGFDWHKCPINENRFNSNGG